MYTCCWGMGGVYVCLPRWLGKCIGCELNPLPGLQVTPITPMQSCYPRPPANLKYMLSILVGYRKGVWGGGVVCSGPCPNSLPASRWMLADWHCRWQAGMSSQTCWATVWPIHWHVSKASLQRAQGAHTYMYMVGVGLYSLFACPGDFRNAEAVC